MLQGGVGSQNACFYASPSANALASCKKSRTVVGFNDRVAELWCRVHTELELGLLAVVGRQTLKEESSETGTGSTTKGVEDEESLQTRAVVSKTADLVHDGVDQPAEKTPRDKHQPFFTIEDDRQSGRTPFRWCSVHGHLSKGEKGALERVYEGDWGNVRRTVVSGIFLASDHGLRMEEGAVGTSPYFIDDIRFKIDVKRAGHVFSGAGLREESAEARIVL